MKVNVDKLPEWLFDIEEISANVYRVWALGPEGQSLEVQGLDPDSLINQCVNDIGKFYLNRDRNELKGNNK